MHNRRRNTDRLELRKMSALTRAADYASLSPAEKLKLLDTRLGAGVGATKQRARLAKVIADSKKPVAKTETPKVQEQKSHGKGKRQERKG